MSRICRFYHNVPRNEEKCGEGHYLAATLDCSVTSCKFVTRPLQISSMDDAIKVMNLHMIGAHPELKDQLKAVVEDDASTKKRKDVDDSTKKNKEVDPNEDYTCPKCFKLFYSKQNVKRHVKTEHERKNRSICLHCDKTFASVAALNYHSKKHHSSSSGIKCDSCGDIYQDFQTYTNHVRSHRSSVGIPQYKCDECHAKFSSSSNLNRHISQVHHIVHFNTKKTSVKLFPFICEECGFFTKRKHYLAVHKLLQHGPDSNMLISCEHCTKTFEYKSNLRRHEISHHKSRIIISDILSSILKSMN